MELKQIKRVLLIDDNEIDRFIHKKLLKHNAIGEEVEECENGKEALKFLQEKVKAGNMPDLILLDLMMPEMDGFEFLAHYDHLIKGVEHRPLLFMVSSTEDDYDLKRSRKNPHIIKLLHKPLVTSSLIDSIKTRS